MPCILMSWLCRLRCLITKFRKCKNTYILARKQVQINNYTTNLKVKDGLVYNHVRTLLWCIYLEITVIFCLPLEVPIDWPSAPWVLLRKWKYRSELKYMQILQRRSNHPCHDWASSTNEESYHPRLFVSQSIWQTILLEFPKMHQLPCKNPN